MGRALIVSAGASSNEYISARLAELGYTRPTIIPSGAEARRRMLESDFELIVVNAPLPDEFGHELCSSAVEKTDAGVVLLAKAAAAEQLLAPMSEQGVLLLSKPFSNTLFLQAIHLAAARWMACRNSVLENGLLSSSTPCSLMGASSCSAAAALASSTTPASVFSTAEEHSSWPNSSGRGALTTINSKSDSSILRRASAPLGMIVGRVYPSSASRAEMYSLELAPALTIRARPI